mmetsp:Transcript_100047/g.252343  ORF Transcript_100047/g.252343 Transcript_100047/m.252343 type:complete len:117 (-) Transcript_100047:892-1242(-)
MQPPEHRASKLHCASLPGNNYNDNNNDHHYNHSNYIHSNNRCSNYHHDNGHSTNEHNDNKHCNKHNHSHDDNIGNHDNRDYLQFYTVSSNDSRSDSVWHIPCKREWIQHRCCDKAT